MLNGLTSPIYKSAQKLKLLPATTYQLNVVLPAGPIAAAESQNGGSFPSPTH